MLCVVFDKGYLMQAFDKMGIRYRNRHLLLLGTRLCAEMVIYYGTNYDRNNELCTSAFVS
jgi:hypothetical protein